MVVAGHSPQLIKVVAPEVPAVAEVELETLQAERQTEAPATHQARLQPKETMVGLVVIPALAVVAVGEQTSQLAREAQGARLLLVEVMEVMEQSAHRLLLLTAALAQAVALLQVISLVVGVAVDWT
jgi:hypothetical protein